MPLISSDEETWLSHSLNQLTANDAYAVKSNYEWLQLHET